MNFSAFGFSEPIHKAIDDMGFSAPTPIQQKAIPAMRKGADVIGRSQTGTGKTLAFALPAIEKIDAHIEKPYAQVLIMCPTRELAQQNDEQVARLAKYMPDIRTACLYGGASMNKQIFELKTANVIIGTPGRIMDHLRRKTLRLDHIKLAVLDEADGLLSVGGYEDLVRFLTQAPESRQTVLFSATMSPDIMRITDEFLTDPELIQIDKQQTTVSNITQGYVRVAGGAKKDALLLLLRYYDPKRAIVFCNTKKMVDELTAFLNAEGFPSECLHGDINQAQRTRVMNDFKSAKTTLLIATDVAARGIDVNDIAYIINYDIPQNAEYYIHRIGRTARAGKSGTAVTIASGSRQVAALKEIAQQTKSAIDLLTIPTSREVKSKAIEGYIREIADTIDNAETQQFKGMYDELTAMGYTPDKIAQAALALQYGKSAAKLQDIKEVAAEKEPAARRGKKQPAFPQNGRGKRQPYQKESYGNNKKQGKTRAR